MISIGIVQNGPELGEAPIVKALSVATKRLAALRGPISLGAQPLVNAVFIVPGSLGAVDFDGAKYGQYSKKDKAVVVQIAVPKKEVANQRSGEYVITALRGANALAFEFFLQQGEGFPLRDAEALVSKLANDLQVTEH